MAPARRGLATLLAAALLAGPALPAAGQNTILAQSQLQTCVNDGSVGPGPALRWGVVPGPRAA